jgi:transcriptional regulator with XRE-family HTH domain
MQKIAPRIKQHDWTQEEAAKRCGVTQPQIDDLVRGRVPPSPSTRRSISRRRLVAGCVLISKLLEPR